MKVLKKILFVLSVIFGTAWGIDVTIPDASAPAGKNVTIVLQASDLTGTDIYSLDFTLIYDESVLSAVNVLSSGTLTSFWGAPTYNISGGRLSVSSGGTEPLTGAGNLIKIVFQVANDADVGVTSPMAFSAFTFNDGSPVPQLTGGTFTVLQDDEPPVFISGPQADPVTVYSATITWRTDEPATSVVQWGETPSYGQVTSSDELERRHSISLTGLKSGRLYYFRAGGSDEHGNGPSFSPGDRFSTPDIVVSLPDAALDPGTTISLPVRSSDLTGQDVTSIHMTIEYNRDILTATGVLSEGTLVRNWPSPLFSVDAGRVSVDMSGGPALSGSGILVKLQMRVKDTAPVGRRTALHFADIQLNGGDVPVVPRDGEFRVKDTRAPVITSGPAAEQVTANSATIRWTTDEKATSMVEFGREGSFGFVEYSYIRKTDHAITLSGLQPETLYYYRVSSTDSSGNGPVKSADYTFTTEKGGDIVVEVADLDANVGSSIAVPVTTTDISGQGVTGLHAVIGYDRNLLQFERVTTSNCLTAGWPALESGSIDGLVTVQNTGETPLSGAGTLFLCHFRVKNSAYNGRTEIQFLNFMYNQGWPQVTVRHGDLDISGRPDVRSPEFVQGPFIDRVTATSARIFWRTDVPTTGEISYGQTPAYGLVEYSSGPAQVHQVTLQNLAPGSAWQCRVKITNPVNNLSALGENSTFLTPAGAAVSVRLNDVQQSAGSQFSMTVETGDVTGLNVYSAYMVLRFDQRYLSVVDVSSAGTISAGWGTPVYTVSPGRLVLTMGGVAPLKNSGPLAGVRFSLADDAPEGYKVPVWFQECIYNEGEPETSASAGMVTVQDVTPPSIVQGPEVFALTPHSAILLWATDGPATSQVEYGTSPGFGDEKRSVQLNTGHLLVLSNLQPNTLYYYQISSADAAGNGPVKGAVETFVTPGIQALSLSVADRTAPPAADVVIPVQISDVTGTSMLSVGFDLTFDPNLLEITGADMAGCFTRDWGELTYELANGRISVLVSGPEVLSGSGTLANMRARISPNADIGTVTPLRLSGFLVNGVSVPVDLQDGELTVSDTGPPVIVSGPFAGTVTAYSAEIGWYTDEQASSIVAYGTTPALGREKSLQKLSREHKVLLDNLTPGSTIYYKAGSVDRFGNGPTWSEQHTFVTLDAQDIRLFLPDTTAKAGDELVIAVRTRDVTGRGITSCSLRVMADEDVSVLAAETAGTLTAGWNAPQLRVEGTVAEIYLAGGVPLTGAGDLVRLRVKISENAAPGAVLPLFFLQAELNGGGFPVQLNNGQIKINDTVPPEIIRGPLVRDVTANSAVIVWSTDEPATGHVEYGTTVQYGFEQSGTGWVKEHEILLVGLQPNTLYHYRVSSMDSLQNGPTVSGDGTFMTVSDAAVRISLADSSTLPGESLLLPVLLGESDVSIEKFECRILFDPEKLAVRGVDQQHSLSRGWPDFILTPGDGQIDITGQGEGISDGGVFFYLRLSVKTGVPPGPAALDFDRFDLNDGGLQAQTFGGHINILDREPPVILNGPVVTSITTTSAVIVWQTSENADGVVEYGKTPALGRQAGHEQLKTDHQVTLRDLVPGTTYYYRVSSSDGAGNGPVQSEVSSFTTASVSGIYLALPDTLAAPGDLLVPVHMKNMSGEPLQSAEIVIQSDAGIVTLTGAAVENAAGAAWPGPGVTVQNGKITLVMSGPPVLPSEGVLVYLRCRVSDDAAAGAKAPLIFSQTVCNHGDLPVTTKNGRIVVKDNNPPQFTVLPGVVQVFYNRATLAWETDEKTTGYVDYGTTAQFGSRVQVTVPGRTHQVDITGLQPATRYFYKVGIVDSSGNGPVESPAGALTTREDALYISSPDTSAAAGSVILWPVRISYTGGYGIKKVEVSVTYDPDILTASGAQLSGTLAQNWPQPLFSDSRGELSVSMSGPDELQGAGVLVFIGFQVAPDAPVGSQTDILISRTVLNGGAVEPAAITSGSLTLLPGSAGAKVRVSLADTSAVPDSLLRMPVLVSDVSGYDIFSFHADIEFDPEVLEMTGIDTAGCLISAWPFPDFFVAENRIQIDASGATAVVDSGVLFYLTVRTQPRLLSGTRSPVEFLAFSFNDYYPGVKTKDGSVTLMTRADAVWGYTQEKTAKTPVDSALVVAEPGGLEFLTARDGYFEFFNLDSSTAYTLAAYKNGYVSTPVEGVAAGGENILIFLQRNDGYIDGRVRDQNNKAIDGVLVIANNDAGSFGSVNTDSTGYFKIAGLAKTSLYTVRASKYGFFDKIVENVTVNTTMDIRLAFQYGNVTGRLTFLDGIPNRTARMRLLKTADPGTVYSVDVDDDGSYRFENIPAGEYILKIFLPGYVSEPGQVQFTLPPGGGFTADFSVEKAVLSRIVIQGKTEIPNNEPAIYETVALTKNDRQMSIEAPMWQLFPEKAGAFDSLQAGTFFPNPFYFGGAVLVAVDVSSGIADTLAVEIYAPVDAGTDAVFENDAGVTLTVQPGCFDGPQKLKIQTVGLPPFKKNAKNASAHGDGYWLKPDGLVLSQPVVLSLPSRNSKNTSRLTIGLWNKQDAEWDIQQNAGFDQNKKSVPIASLGLYALLVRSRPLGIEKIRYLPNPFSPDMDTDGDGHPGLSIHLKVTSLASRTPFVTITVYSMLGTRLRELAVRQPLIKDNDNVIHWDGRTDDGLLARNGRYIVKTRVEDASGSEDHVGTVVLVR